MNKKNGFTLVELLAVILILAIIMVIGVKSILPMISESKRRILYEEGLSLLDAAKTAHEHEIVPDSSLRLTNTESHCFTLNWLKANNYYSKNDEDYNGSVLVLFNNETKKFEYSFWISNNEFYLEDAKPNNYEVKKGELPSGISTCGDISSVGIS